MKARVGAILIEFDKPGKTGEACYHCVSEEKNTL